MPRFRQFDSVAPLALLLGALAALGGTLWLMSSMGYAAAVDPMVNVVDAAAPLPAEAPEVLPDLALPAGTSEVAPRVDIVPVEASQVEVEASVAESAGELDSGTVLALSGRFVEYVDAAPIDSIIEGSAEIMAWAGKNPFHSESLDVKDGEFRIELPQEKGADGRIPSLSRAAGDPISLRFLMGSLTTNAGVTFIPLDLADVSTAMIEPAEVPFGTTDMVVPVRRAAKIELSVLEAGTGRHLDEVEVMASPGLGQYVRRSGDQDGEPMIHGGASPVILEGKGRIASPTAAMLTVRAKGYGTNKITVDFTQPGQRTIELSPAGSLHVKLNGSVPRGAVLRVRGASTQQTEERRPKAGEAFFDALSAGDHQVILEFGSSSRTRVVLASHPVWIVAGMQNELTLDVEPRAPAAWADVRGRLYLPEEWAIDSPRLKVVLISKSKSGQKGEYWLGGRDLVPVEGQPGWFAFSLSSLEIGTYAITFAPLNFAETFELPPEGIANLVMEIPAPLDIVVAIEDAETGEDLPSIQRISWSPVRPKGLDSWTSGVARRDTETNEFPLRVPDCDISIEARGENTRAKEILSPLAGKRYVIKAKPEPSTYLELRSGGETIPWPENEFPDVKRSDGTRARLGFSTSKSQFWLTAKEPGTFFLHVPKISGFEQHPPVEFTLSVGPRKTLVIELTRE